MLEEHRNELGTFYRLMLTLTAASTVVRGDRPKHAIIPMMIPATAIAEAAGYSESYLWRLLRDHEALANEPARRIGHARATERGTVGRLDGAAVVDDDERLRTGAGIVAKYRHRDRPRDRLAVGIDHLHRQLELLLDRARLDRSAGRDRQRAACREPAQRCHACT